MVWHQTPRVRLPPRLGASLSERFQKPLAVGVILEDRLASVARFIT
jgi:hypothetical protein